jgi:hypothetical protein
MSRRTVGLALTWLAVFVTLVLVWPVVSLALDEGAVPPLSAAPPLPPGVRIGQDELRCGSGGCYHQLSLWVPRDQRPAQVAASLGAPHETCRRASLLDRRRVCSGATVDGRRVLLYLRYDRSFYL